MRIPSLFLLAAAGAALIAACSEGERDAAGAPAPPADYVRDSTCERCHAEEFAAWLGSDHDLAMQEARDDTVLGDFDDASFAGTRFHRDGERFLVETEGPGGERADFEVPYVFGVRPLQQLLVRLPRGRLQSFPIAWDTENRTWFSLYPDDAFAHDDPLHWTGRFQRWNTMCASCHSTDVRVGYDLETDSYDTTWKEIDVGCQACHGPGSRHLEWAAAHPDGGARRGEDVGLETELRGHNQRGEFNACAPCHARRSPLTDAHRPSDAFLDGYLPERLGPLTYFPDGQIKDEVYVWGSFVQSKMARAGVTCSDCHDPHGLGLRAEGNALCAQCHRPAPPTDRFPALASKDYDTPEHHHHEPGSPGAKCVSCHMPERTYMVIDPRRDHSMRIPRPDLHDLLGVPDACSSCHPDEEAGWAARKVEEWYGPERPLSFGPLFAVARGGAKEALAPLSGLVANPEVAGIVRATGLELLRGLGNEGMQAAAAMIGDEDPLVRFAAVGSLDSLPAQARTTLVDPLLTDPVRAVRIEAARALSSLPPGEIPEADRAAYDAASEEFIAAQLTQADLPAPHLNLGIFFAARGENERARTEYETALRLEPSFLPARFNLANLLNRAGDNEGAEDVLRGGVTYAPQEPELHFSLGLLLAEMQRLPEALDEMELAARFGPDRPRVHYNLGLLLQKMGRLDEADDALEEAIRRAPRDPDALHALALLRTDRGAFEDALPVAERLYQLVPGDETVLKLLERIHEGLGS
ncbi:MAG TPA: tetratricopeptide repeat protein [Planctomycetes bacterium]|nr:tetratricopeptide repeat protein [Planctomycetota bacterium]